MPAQVTQCPKCHTSFRVTEAQLQIANGAVRCGSCLHIFNATEHWLDGSNRQPEPAAAPVAQPTPQHESEPEPEPQETAADNSALYDIPEDLLEDDQAAAKPESVDELSEELRAIDGDEFESLRSMPDALKSLDEQPEPALNATIEQRALSDIFDNDSFDQEPASLFANDDGDFDVTDSLFADDDSDVEEVDSLEDLINQHADDAGTDSAPQDDSDDDLLISDDMDDDDGDDEPRFGDTTQQPTVDDFDDLDAGPGDSEEDDDDYVFADSEEDDADEDDDRDETTGDFSNSFLDMDEWDDDQDVVFKDLDELGDEESRKKEEEWTQKLLEEDDEPPANEPVAPPAAEDEILHDLFSELEDDDDEQLDPELLDILNEREANNVEETYVEEEFVLGDEPMIAGERIGNEKLAMLANIEPEPVVFAGGSDRDKWIRRAWAAAAVLAVIALGIQYVYFNFDRLARDESYRGSLASVCGVIGCELPGRDDLSAIRSTNLIVRSHPRVGDALVVDAILTNRAMFKQPFPDLELLFSDLSGKIVAGRRFSPQEYLQGELSGMTIMPSQQPVHISLEIVDPGQDAVNYQLHFLPTKNS